MPAWHNLHHRRSAEANARIASIFAQPGVPKLEPLKVGNLGFKLCRFCSVVYSLGVHWGVWCCNRLGERLPG